MKFSKDKFKILQLTDTHFGSLPEAEDDFKTYDLIDKAIKNEDVDLIVHTGDIIWSEGIDDPSAIFKKVMKKLDSYNIPIAITFGNHDSEDNITRSELREIFDSLVTNKSEKTDSFIIDDKEAYTIKLEDENGIVSIIYMIDSSDYDPLNLGIYAYNYPEQVDWFRKTSNKYKKNENIKRSIVFQHIPLVEYWMASDYIIDGVCHETNEMISSPKLNTGLFSAMVLNGEIWGMSVGHDHENNFDSIYQGIHLKYGNSTGFQAYGELAKGVSIFEIEKDPFKISSRNISHNEY